VKCKSTFWLVSLFFAIASPANANAIPWAVGDYERHSTGEELRSVISDLAIESQFGVVIDSSVVGEVNGVFRNVSRGNFFNTLVKTHQLSYFFDGAILWVSNYDDIKAQIITLNHISALEFEREFNALRTESSISTWKILSNDNLLYVVGTRDYVQFMQTFAESIDQPKSGTSNNVIYVHVSKNGTREYSDKAVPAR